MPAPVAALDRTGFLVALRAADLLTPAQLTKAKAIPAADAEIMAAALVSGGQLTRFQADRLLAGRADGFHLGPYVILDQVGRGAQSRVYRAKHRTMHRVVAVKVLAAELTQTPAQREAVRAAVRDAGKLIHPNIVTAYDADERNDRFYLVLEFVDGADLGALVRAHGPLPVAEACEYVRQIAAGLGHAHEKGMAHRDLKPANLLVTRPAAGIGPTVKITDFGLPKAPGAAGEFAAPEAGPPAGAAGCARSSTGAASAPTGDHRADLYSLGRVFHFLLTGQSGREVLPLAQLRPDVPADVAAVVHKLLARNPADRFASATELLARLESACVPTALPVDGAVNFDLPASAHPGCDSGFLTGRQPRPAADASPWAEITGAGGDTAPLRLEDTPPPRRAGPRRAGRPRRGPEMPLWMSATLFLGAVLLCVMGVAAVVKALAK